MIFDSINWGKGGFERCNMHPMGQPTWDDLLILPDDTEVMVIFVLPLGVALKGAQFIMSPENRRSLERMRDDGETATPTFAAYLLPPIEVPDPEAFFASDNPRKDADK